MCLCERELVCVCVYWKAGSKFPTTVVIASSFVGLAGTEIYLKQKKKEEHEKSCKKNKGGLKRGEDGGEEKTRERGKTGRERDRDCCRAKWAVRGFVRSADISGGAGCHSYRCFRAIHTHTHTVKHKHIAPESSAAREHCGSQRVQCWANLKTATTAASCTAGVRPSTWVAERDLRQL